MPAHVARWAAEVDVDVARLLAELAAPGRSSRPTPRWRPSSRPSTTTFLDAVAGTVASWSLPIGP